MSAVTPSVGTALVAGASGLVGGHLLTRLLDDDRWDRVLSLGRRELPVAHPKLEQRVVELTAVEDLDLPPVHDAFSCLGTTIRAAGSQAAFRAVDHDAVLTVARCAQAAGATGFWHVTALGAAPDSRIFYNRVKGETERDVAALGFERYAAFRPSMLDGDREETRLGEAVGLRAMRLAGPLLGRYRPTLAVDVASAMVAVARGGSDDHVVDAGAITRIAASM